jgi:glucosylceramidase
MNRIKKLLLVSVLPLTLSQLNGVEVEVFETSRQGSKYEKVELKSNPDVLPLLITVDLDSKLQTVEGFGASLTESTAYVLDQLPESKRDAVLAKTFSKAGAGFSMIRTHIASCDFSLGSYTYAADPEADLADFSIEEDREDLLPLIKDSLAQEGADFKIVSSPWTAPPWMKDNNHFFAGELLPEHHSTFARYMVKYIEAYKAEGVDVWGVTPVNEPHGNDGNWESMHFDGHQMADYIEGHLGPQFEAAGLDTKIFIFDQNRSEAVEFVEPILHGGAAKYVDGIALHWYGSTYDFYPDVLDELSERFPDYPFFHSEGCIDATGDNEKEGSWLEEDWYWRPEATDWGYVWATEKDKPDHPPYHPIYRYARDIIGGLNHGFFGWVDWNLALDFNGGPNHVSNFCGAPILVDTENKEVFYTPLFYCIKHFSKSIRPGAKILKTTSTYDPIMVTAAENTDGSIVIVALNMGGADQTMRYKVADKEFTDTLQNQSLRTYILHP